METFEDFQAVFARRGVELTEEEIAEIYSEVGARFDDGELNESNLEEVAGGGITWGMAVGAWRVGARIGMGARMLYDKKVHGNAQYTYTYDQLRRGSIW